jgi:flavin-dependent dehydrogenase
MLIGDAAGLAFEQSGEGIRPAIESGILAAQVILGANGRYSSDRLQPYCDLLEARFGQRGARRANALSSLCPDSTIRLAAGLLFANTLFTRRVLLDRWFLRTSVRTLVPRASARGGLPYQKGSRLS